MKTYTVTRNTPSHVLNMKTETLTVRSFDNPDHAATEILAQLGFVISACCDASDDVPCDRCREDLSLAAQRRLDLARAEEGT